MHVSCHRFCRLLRSLDLVTVETQLRFVLVLTKCPVIMSGLLASYFSSEQSTRGELRIGLQSFDWNAQFQLLGLLAVVR